MIIDHDHPMYRRAWGSGGSALKWNGAFYYSKEIRKNIIPRIKTDRNWVLINTRSVGADHSIVFIHNNLHPENYEWLKRYNDLILVCGVPETCKKVAHLGKAVYLPNSVDVEYVEQFKVDEKTKDAAFVGRSAKRKKEIYHGVELPDGIDFIEGLPRTKILPAMAQYKKVYAVGRTAIEAKILGCEVLPYDPRFPDPSVWKIFDNKDAAVMLQALLDEAEADESWNRINRKPKPTPHRLNVINKEICPHCGMITAYTSMGRCFMCGKEK